MHHKEKELSSVNETHLSAQGWSWKGARINVGSWESVGVQISFREGFEPPRKNHFEVGHLWL
jgi:hypothetical protein